MIVRMKRMTLYFLKQDEQSMLRALQDIAAVEIISMSEGERKSDALDAADKRVAEMSAGLAAVRAYAPKAGFLDAKRRETLPALVSSQPDAERFTARIEQLTHTRANLKAERDKTTDTLLQLQPWLAFSAPMDSLRNTDTVKYFLGFLAARDMDALKQQDFLMCETYNEGASVAVLAACHASDANAAAAFFKSVDWTDASFPHMAGTPKEASDKLRAACADIDAQLDAIAKELETLAADIKTLENGVDTALVARDREEAACELSRTRSTDILEGWCREDEQDKIIAAVSSVTDAYDLEFREPAENEAAPSVVQNDSFHTPFEAVNNLYSRPDPRGIDATPFMTPWYILLFGMMLSDTGYGILLMIGTALYLKFKKPTGMSGGIAKVLFWGGLSTIVWGVLIGTFFGAEFNDIFHTTVFPLLMNPLDDPITMLILCFALGIVHMLCGYAIKIFMCFRDGDWQTAIFDNLSWMLIIIGIIVWLLPGFVSALPTFLTVVGLVMIALGVAFILFFKGRAKKNPLSRVVSGLGGLYDITGVLSDVLSYARLFALGIATGVIASVFNDICGMLMGGSGVFGVLGFIIGCALLAVLHVFNLGINTLGAFVHCARLQYVEFYGKFYEAGGRTFKPLSYRTKHTVISNN